MSKIEKCKKAANIACLSLLPEKLKKWYKTAYKSFKNWYQTKNYSQLCQKIYFIKVFIKFVVLVFYVEICYFHKEKAKQFKISKTADKNDLKPKQSSVFTKEKISNYNYNRNC